MTTQGTSLTAGNSNFSKIYTDTSTDGVWSGNVLTDTISQQSIGILTPNAIVSWVQPEYEAGCMAWRLQNAQTLAVSAYGFGCKATFNDKEYLSNPVRINPNDIISVFPLAVAAGTNANSLAWVSTTKGTELFQATAADNTATSMTTAINAQSLGDAFFNSTLGSITVQCEDGARLDSVTIIDNAGGVVMTVQGNVRGAVLGATGNYYNIDCSMLSVGIGKGFKLQITTVSA